MSAAGLLLPAAVLLPATAAAAGLLPRARRAACRLAVAGSALAATAAVALAVVVAVEGPAATARPGVSSDLWVGLVADRLTVTLLVLVCAVSAVVQVFARRQLQGDPGGRRFAARAGFLTAATTAMVTAASLPALALAWSLAGAALVALVGLYRPAPAAREAARRTARMVLYGDAALWTAVVLHLAAGGESDLRRLAADPAPAAGGVTGAVIGCLLVVAAAVRCAQLPWHRWLPASLAAPTPVSALLHAGVVNAGGILLIRLHPVVAASWWATWLTVALSTVTAVTATLIMLVRPDIKGALVHSTMAQMAFMLLSCAMGLLAAAAAHLIAHGLFKANLFLGSGSAAHAHVRRLQEPPPAPIGRTRAAVLAGLALAAAALAITFAARLLHPQQQSGAAVLLAFTVVTAAAAAWGWLRRHSTPMGVVLLLVGLPALAGGYLTVLTAVTRVLGPALAPAGPAAAPPWTLAAVLVLLAAAALLPAPSQRRAGLKARLYAFVLAAGQPPLTAPPALRASVSVPVPTPVPTAPAATPASVRVLATQSEGVHP
ncbi:proton-conducting transporter membrane subunit [Streptomyces sp. NPDC000987]|uniref:proton-conducting transporter transmembrane domain-containing protein n=1 Tax=Streptomyces sp. NPDC000987 TaxID=3154374 RepID=UPI003321C3DC